MHTSHVQCMCMENRANHMIIKVILKKILESEITHQMEPNHTKSLCCFHQ